MGKSGAQAASRRSIKKGKDACQRKLWNNAVSTLFSKFESLTIFELLIFHNFNWSIIFTYLNSLIIGR
jgi:hypothetical protein